MAKRNSTTSSDWSATPVPVPYATFDDPQTLNQYSYVRNIPTVKADPDGHDGGTAVLDKAVEYVEDGLAKLVDGTEGAGPAISGSAILTGGAIVAVGRQSNPAGELCGHLVPNWFCKKPSDVAQRYCNRNKRW